ncbi:MAG: glycoside hydrolase family 27 protein [Steroidobacteraceae bacterium]|jgi:alpha-galactosidase
MKKSSLILLAALSSFAASMGSAADPHQVFTPRAPNGLALTPPMGWNSWNKYHCDISEATIRKQADAMVDSGMKAAGYVYIVIDDCWHGQRDSLGNIQADPVRFASGIKALADYVHGKGLKFGIYSDTGDKTCEKKPGSRGHEYQDAAQYAAWGVDYLKYDWCYSESLEVRAAYETMSDALRATGRPIVFSICEWGTHQPWSWAASVGGNLWRTTGDIYDAWQSAADSNEGSGVLDILDRQVGLAGFAGPGHWNDPDMLEVGNGGMSDDEYRAHFGLWAMLAAPLIAGNDLSTMTEATRRILNNREVIAVDQDALGIEARRAVKLADTEIWVRPLAGGSQAVALLNRGAEPRSIRLDWSALNLPSYVTLDVRDLWLGKDQPRATGSLTAEVKPHALVMLKVTPARNNRQ